MQYANMIDLIPKARLAGVHKATLMSDQVANAFERWLDTQHLGEITEEEEEVLRRSFEDGFAHYYTA
jgi:hypothetical protein